MTGRLLRYLDGRDQNDEAGWEDGPILIDLACSTDPDGRAYQRAWAAALDLQDDVTVRAPAAPEVDDLNLICRIDPSTVVVADVASVGEVTRWAQAARSRGIRADLVAEVRTGSAMFEVGPILAADERVRGIWYAVADLLVDFAPGHPGPYFYDNSEPRLASPRWARSRLLTYARAFRAELWGQLDLTVVDPAPSEAARAAWLAACSGFDVIVCRRRPAPRDEALAHSTTTPTV